MPLIVFEGGEGAGKSTQIDLTNSWLSELKYNVVQTREPGATELGVELRKLLLGTKELDPTASLLLYAADRVEHVNKVIKPYLEKDFIILCDRYTDSTVAYQGYGRQYDLEVINYLNQISSSGIKPDLTIWLDIDPEIGLARAAKRGKLDHFEMQKLEFHQRVREGYQALSKDNPNYCRIDAEGDEIKVQSEIRAAISLFLNYQSKFNKNQGYVI